LTINYLQKWHNPGVTKIKRNVTRNFHSNGHLNVYKLVTKFDFLANFPFGTMLKNGRLTMTASPRGLRIGSH